MKVHSLTGTAADIEDITESEHLLHGEETEACEDAGYTSVAKHRVPRVGLGYPAISFCLSLIGQIQSNRLIFDRKNRIMKLKIISQVTDGIDSRPKSNGFNNNVKCCQCISRF